MAQHTQADASEHTNTAKAQSGVEQGIQGLRMIACPICLLAVPHTRDAFLEPCYHAFCGECLRGWMQTEILKRDPEFRCPVCRTPAEVRIFSTEHGTFHRQALPSASIATPTLPATFPLTLQHVRRRQAYNEVCLTANTELCCCSDSPSQAEHSRSAPAARIGSNNGGEVPGWQHPQASMRHPDNYTLLLWIKRELQALLRCDEPGTAQQVLLHTLRCTIGDRTRNKSCKRVPCSPGDRCSVHRAVAAAMQLYLGTSHSCKFAGYLVSFLSSVESIATWDRGMSNRAASASQTTTAPSYSQAFTSTVNPAESQGGAAGVHAVPKHLLLGSTDDEGPSDVETDPGSGC